MAATDHTADEARPQVERLSASVARLREVAAADRASRQIDEAVQTLEPRVNTMREAAAALTILVNLSGRCSGSWWTPSTSWSRAISVPRHRQTNHRLHLVSEIRTNREKGEPD